MTPLTAVGAPAGYRVLDADGAAELAARHLDAPPTRVDEISDGNLNLVYRVATESQSIVLKQALPYLRLAGEGWPLTLDRARIEAEALGIQARFAPAQLPRLVEFEPSLCAILLEDLAPAQIWRTALCRAEAISEVPQQVGEFVARVSLGTSSMLMSESERKALRSRFTNPELCAITEDLVLTSPFEDSPSNDYDDEIADLAAAIRGDAELTSRVRRLRYEYRTRSESLLHGDLHTGSVMATPGDARIIDPEFAFFGPVGFDTGNVLANLALAGIAHASAGRSGFAALVDGMAADFWRSFVNTAKTAWPRDEPWYPLWLADVLTDSAGYAGCEMVRRVIGMAHAADINALEGQSRQLAQRAAVNSGRSLLLSPSPRTFEDLWAHIVS